MHTCALRAQSKTSLSREPKYQTTSASIIDKRRCTSLGPRYFINCMYVLISKDHDKLYARTNTLRGKQRQSLETRHCPFHRPSRHSPIEPPHQPPPFDHNFSPCSKSIPENNLVSASRPSRPGSARVTARGSTASQDGAGTPREGEGG